MVELELRFDAGDWEYLRAALPVQIGRGADCALRIKSWRVARRHACLERRTTGVFVRDLGTVAGTLVNGSAIAEYGPLGPGDEITIGHCTLRLCSASPMAAVARVAEATSVQAGQQSVSRESLPSHRRARPDISAVSRALDGEECELNLPAGGSADAHCPLNEPAGISEPRDAALHAHRKRLHGLLLDALDLRRRDVASLSDEALRVEARRVLAELIAADVLLPAGADRAELLREVVNEAVGLGALEPLLEDASVTEIMVNRHDEIFVEVSGRLRRHAGMFSSEDAVRGVIERIVSPLGRRVDESSPMVDARLADGSRINAVIPPVALRGASLTIRKFAQSRPGMDDLLRAGALDRSMSEFLAACVAGRKNIIVSGGMGSGKTTLLNVLSNCIGSHERIITIEDAAELRLNHPHLVALEARPANSEGRGRVEIRDLVRNALRMRPDRIVIGECRGSEAFDMLAAMNTGHEGSLTTLHANSPRDALSRLETMILMAGMDLPLMAVREHIAASIDFIIQQARLADGRRLLSSIVEVTGMESGRIQTQEIFRYQARPVPSFAGCGVMPDCFVNEEGTSTLALALFNAHTQITAVGSLDASMGAPDSPVVPAAQSHMGNWQ